MPFHALPCSAIAFHATLCQIPYNIPYHTIGYHIPHTKCLIPHTTYLYHTHTQRCGSFWHSWLVCHTTYLKMFLQHSYQYLWWVMKSSCTWSKLQKYISFTLSQWNIHSGFLIIYQGEKGQKVPIFDQVWPITAGEILKNDAPRGVRKSQVVTRSEKESIYKEK